MIAEIVRRIAFLPVTLFVVATLVFIALRALPGSTVDMLSSQFATAGLRDQLIAQLGLDLPLWQQYLIYLRELVTFDLGRSFITGKDVSVMVGETLPVTIELALASLIVMVLFGLGAGMAAAARPGSLIDASLRFVAMTLFALPWFWFGIILIIVFSLWLGWLPSFGRLPSTLDYQPVTNFVLVDAIALGRPDLIGPWLAHLILPALTVGLTTSGMLMRLARSGIIETGRLDFVRTARMKGVPGGRIFFRHILRNAALGVLTVIGLQFGAMLGGSVIAEVVFGYPGIGRMMIDAVLTRDYAVAQGAALVIATLYVFVNLATDLAYRWADPRLRREPGR
ncbi:MULTISPECIES: ABC transporter permease [unclassified Roseitalea]|uniref:ABC transporter permease n=1 Tax=unclassified Roseitalea TaxID=2639107 RepID=UPI00273FBC8B|nr:MULTISPECIES: ABC transporter permease [unclassified Roseitalea]